MFRRLLKTQPDFCRILLLKLVLRLLIFALKKLNYQKMKSFGSSLWDFYDLQMLHLLYFKAKSNETISNLRLMQKQEK